MITDKSEMISIDRLPYKWREKIKEELKMPKTYDKKAWLEQKELTKEENLKNYTEYSQ